MVLVGIIQFPALCRMPKILTVNKHANDSKQTEEAKCAALAEPPKSGGEGI